MSRDRHRRRPTGCTSGRCCVLSNAWSNCGSIHGSWSHRSHTENDKIQMSFIADKMLLSRWSVDPETSNLEPNIYKVMCLVKIHKNTVMEIIEFWSQRFHMLMLTGPKVWRMSSSGCYAPRKHITMHQERKSCLCKFEYCTMAMRDSVNHQSRMSKFHHCKVFELSCPKTMKITKGESMHRPTTTEILTRPESKGPAICTQYESELYPPRTRHATMPKAPKIHLALEFSQMQCQELPKSIWR